MTVLILIFILSLLNGCSTNEPPVDQNTLKLNLIDVGVREAYIKLETEKIDKDIFLIRNNKAIIKISPTGLDSILTDTTLVANTTYKYYAAIIENGDVSSKSNELSITSLNPSSHDFTWKKYLFGEASYSEFKDVSIINENDIWVVGRVMLRDSLGNPDPNIYNALHWDGEKWNLERVLLKDYGEITAYFSLESVYGDNSKNVWFSSIVELLKWNNNNFQSSAFFMKSIPFNGQITKILAIYNNVYCVGRNGTIFYYKENNDWQQLTVMEVHDDINDVWGIEKPDGNYELYCPITYANKLNEKNIIKIDKNNKITFLNSFPERLINSIWTHNGFPIYTSGDGMFTNKTGIWKEVNYGVNKALMKIRGTGLNDIIAAGLDGTIVHYNGTDWKEYTEIGGEALFNSVAIKGNIAVAVGMENYKAVIAIGRR